MESDPFAERKATKSATHSPRLFIVVFRSAKGCMENDPFAGRKATKSGTHSPRVFIVFRSAKGCMENDPFAERKATTSATYSPRIFNVAFSLRERTHGKCVSAQAGVWNWQAAHRAFGPLPWRANRRCCADGPVMPAKATDRAMHTSPDFFDFFATSTMVVLVDYQRVGAIVDRRPLVRSVGRTDCQSVPRSNSQVNRCEIREP
jgi:hypothetical protein